MNDIKGDVAYVDNNHYGLQVPLVYALACCTLKYYINEFSAWNRLGLDAPLPVDELQGLELRQKYILVPSLFRQKTFEKGAMPYKDFDVLVRLRNDVIHYKMGTRPSYLPRL